MRVPSEQRVDVLTLAMAERAVLLPLALVARAAALVVVVRLAEHLGARLLAHRGVRFPLALRCLTEFFVVQAWALVAHPAGMARRDLAVPGAAELLAAVLLDDPLALGLAALDVAARVTGRPASKGGGGGGGGRENEDGVFPEIFGGNRKEKGKPHSVSLGMSQPRRWFAIAQV